MPVQGCTLPLIMDNLSALDIQLSTSLVVRLEEASPVTRAVWDSLYKLFHYMSGQAVRAAGG